MTTKKNSYFEPWVGENYETGFNGKKVLVLGDSHYCGEDDCKEICGVKGMPLEDFKCAKFTNDIISDIIKNPRSDGSDNYKKTFMAFAKTMLSKSNPSDEDIEKLWNSVSFYNFVQTAYQNSYDAEYTPEDHRASIPYFFKLIEELQPDCVIVWGAKTRDALCEAGDYILTETKLVANEKTNAITLEKGGKTVNFLYIHHPSMGYSQEYWTKVIAGFFQKI